MEDRQMYKTVCAECGKECEVPFKPEQDRPVYCKDCFRKRRPKRNFGRNQRFGDRPRQMYKATCSDCGKECEVPFKPTEGKPVRCRDCYAKYKENPESHGNSGAQESQQDSDDQESTTDF